MAITADRLPTPASTTTATVGKDFLIYVNTGTSEADAKWTVVGGQRNSKLSLKADEVDVSDKTSGGWGAKLAGTRQWSFELSGLVMLNDDGVSALQALFLAGKLAHVKFEYPDKKYQVGWAAITDFSFDTPHDGAATLTGTLSGNGPLSDIIDPSSASGGTSE